ncbi:hypothetical protein ACHAWF_018287 [Thalassiosira exigua]
MSSSASAPKIVLATTKKKKKKKKPLISLGGKNPSDASASSSSAAAAGRTGRPPSPDTVAAGPSPSAAAGGNEGGGSGAGNGGTSASSTTRKPRGKSGGIFIKPFERPPELPPDFYDASLEVLRRAANCVLRHEALTAPASSPTEVSNAAGGPTRLVGREELYRSVEDLVVHGFGTRLYRDVADVVDGAAGEAVRRLADPAGGGGDGAAALLDEGTGDVGYVASTLIHDLALKERGAGGGGGGGGGENQRRRALLQRMRDVCRTAYAEEYLAFVRSVFLALDRAFVYLADRGSEDVGVSYDVGAGADGGPPKGRVLERSAASSLGGTAAGRAWGLQEVGVACLRARMLRRPSVGVPGNADDVLPALTAMVLTTAHAILSEYDGDADGAGGPGDATRPLVRDCVRALVDLGSLSSLLEKLIVAASHRLAVEGREWSAILSEEGGGAASKSSRTPAAEFLRHAEGRLRRGASLAGYYLPSSAASQTALRILADRDCLTGAVSSSSLSSSSLKVVWNRADDTTRRILPAIVEERLLGPRLLPDAGGILAPRHLYPMLDDDDGSHAGGGSMAWKCHHGGSKAYDDARRLYGLCWRMTVSAATSSDGGETMLSVGPSGREVTASALDRLRTAFGEYGRLRGAEIVGRGPSDVGGAPVANAKEAEKRIVPDLLAFKRHLYALHAIAFRGDKGFDAAIRSILEDVLNGSADGGRDGDGGRRMAELLAKHVDARFKDAKAQAGAAAAATTTPAPPGATAPVAAADANESFQDEILSLFRHVHSKDIFEAFYKRDLAKRLLTGRAVSTDMERSFLSKLKAECGAGYTSKMEGMFKDMELSRDIMGSYAAYAAGSGASARGGDGVKEAEVDVRVLTTGYWPVYPKHPNIILPPELVVPRSKFESYYDDKYQGRRIAWQYSLGNCIVKANFPSSNAPKELIVNMCQSLVLLCFRTDDGPDRKGLTLEDIAKKTGIEDRGELERVLQSLSMGRDGTRVLRKVDYDSPTVKAGAVPSPDGNGNAGDNKEGKGSPRKAGKKTRIRRAVGPHDRFLFNRNFVSAQRRIRITNITMKETSEERAETHAAVSKDRLYFIDAAVVRIMKARKAIGHRDLIGEVMSQLKFPASGADVKKRIESLIEREYMERVEGDRSRYKYLA